MGHSPASEAYVRVDLLRARFEESGMSKGELARRMGWTRPQIDKLNRTLGYRPDSNSHGVRTKPREFVTYETAERFCRALNADPVDVGI